MKVKANFDYNDILLKRLVKKDEVIEVDDVRAKVLTTELYNGVPFCNIVEEKPKRKRTRKAKVEE